MRLKSKTPSRDDTRERLVACADAAIAAGGIGALRARTLADCAGCSVGAIYNLVADLDELVLRVGQRTLAELGAGLDAIPSTATPADQLVGWALAYCRFAAAHPHRLRALFEFRLAPGRDLPDWFAADQARLFERLEAALATLTPGLGLAARRLRARTLFSAVHGIVTLGIEEKLTLMPQATLEGELEAFVRAYLTGSGLKPRGRR